MNENERWFRTLGALAEIAHDENESPERRRIALRALEHAHMSMYSGKSAWDSAMTPRNDTITTPGGVFLHTLGVEEGWSI